jgi:5,10-methylenetetrahydromethanopterin reductase
MRYGLFLGGEANDVKACVAAVRQAAADGFASAWLPQIFGVDALMALALAGAAVPDIELGTAVVPTYPRHPMAMASQALTVQAATANRLVLGIGLSHQIVVEGMWGYSFDKPARHMREYLDALMPLLRGESVNVQGETLKCVGQVDVKDAAAPPVLIAALAPVMLKLAGAVADGTATWMVGPATLADHITPSITKAASEAGRPAPRIAVGLPVCLTNDADAARERVARELVIYGQLPSYRAMLDREGVEGPAGVAIAGDEAAIRAGVQRIADAGGTDLIASCFGSPEEIVRTTAFLADLAK